MLIICPQHFKLEHALVTLRAHFSNRKNETAFVLFAQRSIYYRYVFTGN